MKTTITTICRPILLSCLLLAWSDARAADDPVETLPEHLLHSGICTQDEVQLAEAWVEKITSVDGDPVSADERFENWLGAGLPFSFLYAGKTSHPAADGWELARRGPTREDHAEKRELSWIEPRSGLKVTWQVKRFLKYPAVEWLVTFENTGSEDTQIIENVQSLSLDMSHAPNGKQYTVHGANGGRSMPDDFVPFAVPVPDLEDKTQPSFSLLRQDFEQMQVGRSILGTPLVIGKRTFDHGVGTHSVSRIEIRSPQPIDRFSAWIGVDHNERTGSGAGSVVFSVWADETEVYRSPIMRGGEEPVRLEVDTKGAKLLKLNVDDAGDGPTCDHADWADAAIVIRDRGSVRLDSLAQTPSDRVQLGSTSHSSNNHLPFFNIESPENRGILVGLGWTGQWQAEITRRGAGCHAQAGLRATRFSLRPGEKVRTPRVLLVLWNGKRLHGHNMLRRLLHEQYVPHLDGHPQQPLVSVNVCFTHHGKGGFLEKATEKEVLALVPPFLELGAEALVIDAGWYDCESWVDILRNPDFVYSKTKYPRGFQPIAQPLAQAGADFGLWFPPEAFGSFADPAVAEKFLAYIDTYVRDEGLTMYRQDAGILPTDEDPDRLGIGEMQHIAGLYAMQDELRRRHPALLMEGCCGGGRRIDLESLSRFHWHQKSDRWFDTLSDHSGLCGANLFLPGGVINVPTEVTDDYGAWSSFGGQFCLAWHPLDEDFPTQQAARQVKLYKRVRPFLSGDFYPLSPCSLTKPWLAYQFHRNDLDRGFALVFKRNADEGNVFKFAPRALAPEARYSLTFESSGARADYPGRELAGAIEIAMESTPGAELISYQRQTAGE